MPSQMNQALQISLGHLASLEIQKRYWIQGTKDEYLLPEEVLESALNWPRSSLENDDLDQAKRDSLSKFIAIFNENIDKISIDDEGTSNERLILHDQYWSAIRAAAKECLKELGLQIVTADSV